MLVACYGSLKKGHYNHDCLGKDAKFLGNSTVFAVMYSNGSYPKLYKGVDQFEEDAELRAKFLADPAFEDNKARQHELEIYDVSEQAYEGIRGMELGAGYEEEQIETPFGSAAIYWMPLGRAGSFDHWVESYTDGKVSE